MIRKILVFCALLVALATPSLAVEPDEMLDDPVLEARAREISKKLRCVVCQNQDIDSSNAGVARDLRLLVRERLVAGDSDKEVLQFVTARYGDYVLLRPPWKPGTYALWLGPVALLIIGIGAVTMVLRGARRRAAAAGLSDDEERAVAEILSRNAEGGK